MIIGEWELVCVFNVALMLILHFFFKDNFYYSSIINLAA